MSLRIILSLALLASAMLGLAACGPNGLIPDPTPSPPSNSRQGGY